MSGNADLIKAKLKAMSEFLNPEDDGPDSDSEDDFGFDTPPSRSSSRNSETSASTKASENSNTTGSGSSLLESVKGFKFTSREEEQDAEADAEFGLERTKTPEPMNTKQDKPSIKKLTVPQGLGEKIGGKYVATKKEQKEPGKLKADTSAVADLFAKPRVKPEDRVSDTIAENKPVTKPKLPNDLLKSLNKNQEPQEPREENKTESQPESQTPAVEDKSKYLQKRGSMNFTDPTDEKDTPQEKAAKQEIVDGLIYLMEITTEQLSEGSMFTAPCKTAIMALKEAKQHLPDDQTLTNLANKTTILLTTAIMGEAEKCNSDNNAKANNPNSPSAAQKMGFFQQVLSGLSMVIRKLADVISTKHPKASAKLEFVADKVDQVGGFIKKMSDKFRQKGA